MTDDLGGNTEDLLTLRQSHPAEPDTDKPTVADAEAANRRMGRMFGAIGTTLVIAPALAVLLVLVLCRDSLELDTVNRFLVLVLYVTCTMLGTTFIALFFAERLQRYPRAQIRQLLLREDERDRQLDRLIEVARVGSVKMEALETAVQAVPAYGEGVITGIQLRQSVIGPETN